MKHLGARTILAFSAVGSLREEIAPKDFVIPSQIIDRTKGIRRASYFGEGEEHAVIAHASFGDPYDKVLSPIVTGMYVLTQLTQRVRDPRRAFANGQGALKQNGCLYGGPRFLDPSRIEHVPSAGR